jgi:hypothetical protein
MSSGELPPSAHSLMSAALLVFASSRLLRSCGNTENNFGYGGVSGGTRRQNPGRYSDLAAP